MEYGKKSDGFQTLLEHWVILITALIAIAFGEVLTFFFNLSGTPWICLFSTGMVLLCSGALLILYAKLPVYRTRHFFTFGVKSIPVGLAGYYRWGWRKFFFRRGIVVLLVAFQTMMFLRYGPPGISRNSWSLDLRWGGGAGLDSPLCCQ
jgi:hypothetical protein